jgi:hypothetical protein
MQRSAPAVLLAFPLLAVLAGCASPTFWPEFTRTLFDAPAGSVCRITIHNGQPRSYSVTVGMDSVPEKVRHKMASDRLGGGGRVDSVARECGPWGPGYRWNQLVRVGDRDERRSWLLDKEGNVMERSYEVSRDRVPTAVLEHAGSVDTVTPTTVQRVSLVLDVPGAEGHYRMHLQAKDGRQWIVRCRADGSEAATYRVIRAEVSSTR